MATKKQAQKTASKYGASIERTDMLDGSFDIEAIAPDGKQWSEGVVTLIEPYHTHFGDKASDGYKSIIERMEANEIENIEE